MDDFLTIHIDIVTLLELDIKKNNNKEKNRKEKRDRENEKKITYIDTYLYRFVGCNIDVIFLLMKKKSVRKNNFISFSNAK